MANDDAVVHFFWSNGIRYVAFLPAMTYFRTRDEPHYQAIKGNLNVARIPYYERPTNENIDSRVYGTQIYDMGEILQHNEIESWIDGVHYGADFLIAATDSHTFNLEAMLRKFLERQGYTFAADAKFNNKLVVTPPKDDLLAKILANQADMAKMIALLQQAIKDLPGSIEVVKPT